MPRDRKWPAERAETAVAEVAREPRRLPSGIVTFVLTDIEGSTRLFRELGEAYLEVLATHNELLRAAVSNHGGVEVGTEGDSLLVAFSDPSEALSACLEGQQALIAQRWPHGVEVRVRMGVHTGEATPVGDDYVALPLHQVARISAGAHGGQVLVSEATNVNVEGRLPAGVSLIALGSFQLRGFPAPERLYQLRHADLRAEFPPLRAIGVLAHNLPFLRAGFVGRAEERATLAESLRTTGIVTVVGPGGVGKTRLAVQVAFDVLEEFEDGAWLVELAPLTDRASVPRAVASAMGIAEVPGRSVDDVLVEALSHKSALLMLDNCEHLLDGVASLAEFLSQRCPHLVIFSTSREPLDIEGEVVWRVEPLGTVDPDRNTSLAEVAASEAAQLFTERASLVRPGFELDENNAAEVAQIVSHLNGIPLAIELAAAALAERSLSGVLSGLTDRFSLLIRGRRTAPSRHQTLRAALEWSLDLLSPPERLLFDRLSVFAGGATIDAAVAVGVGGAVEGTQVPELLGHLVRASLLSIDPGAPDRWGMLESIRDLGALELAEVGETEEITRRHRTWTAERVEAVEDRIGRRGHTTVMIELAKDRDNVRRAIESAVSADDPEIALRICTAMSPFWMSHGDWTEGIEHLRRALALGGGNDALRGPALAALGSLLLLRGELDEAKDCFEEAKLAATAAGDDLTMARALAGDGHVAFRHSELGEAQAHWEEALARAERSGDQRVAANVLRSLAIAAGTVGRQDRAGDFLDRAIALARASGDDQLLRLLLGSSAEMNIWLGRYPVAEAAYGDALSLATAIGDISARPLLLAELGWVALLRGDPLTARRLSIEAAELAEDLGTPRVLAHAHRLSGEALIRLGDADGATADLDRALTVAGSLHAAAEVAGVRCSQACLALELREFDRARFHASEAIGLSALGHTMRRTTLQWVLATIAMHEGDTNAAREQFRQGLTEAERSGILRYQAAYLLGLGGVEAAEGHKGEAALLYWRALGLNREIGDRLGVIDCLVGLAMVMPEEEAKAAARLVGAAGSLRANLGAIATPYEEEQVARATAAVSDVVGQDLTAEWVAEGSGLDEAQAVATAEHLMSTSDATETLREARDPGGSTRSQ
jgi:predicted ATPase/class 3 adenylate cyclase